jgi:hypothetical protein
MPANTRGAFEGKQIDVFLTMKTTIIKYPVVAIVAATFLAGIAVAGPGSATTPMPARSGIQTRSSAKVSFNRLNHNSASIRPKRPLSPVGYKEWIGSIDPSPNARP